MTARAEYRLSLRADNATTRLGQAALAAGCLSAARESFVRRHFEERASSAWSQTAEGQADALYAPYVDRQASEWERIQRDKDVKIAPDFDYGAVPGLSTEMRERFSASRPETLDQASRIAGISPAALAALYVSVTRKRRAA